MSIRAVHHINCATLCPIAGFLVGGQGLGRGHMVAHCIVVETERDGLVLIDTGFGTRDVEGKTPLSRAFRSLVGPKLAADETAIAQVARLGYRPEDVRHIVVTHLDLDHAGGLCDFPNAKVHLHAREHAAAMTRRNFKERERYLSVHWTHGPSGRSTPRTATPGADCPRSRGCAASMQTSGSCRCTATPADTPP
jgi:glyoxylase-like metal-dependent hydrolase (beta-lactamase superfamily II)